MLPYEDCCVIFSPKHPMLRAQLERERAEYEALELTGLLAEALDAAEKTNIPFSAVLSG
jgi:tRNA uracil 4-sulfurtransferase